MAKGTGNKNDGAVKQVVEGVTYFERPTIDVAGQKYRRLAIQTHFIQKGESFLAVCRKYVKPLAEAGDILSSSEKIVSICQGNTVDMKDVKLGFWAKNLSKLASRSEMGVGMDEPYKLQLAIDIAGLPRILFAVFCGGIGKLFGIKGWFYKVAGNGIAGMDGFYSRSDFKEYHTMAILLPAQPDKACKEIAEDLGIAVAIVDANDVSVETLGSYGLKDNNEFLQMIRDNPAGQSDELTPLILIKKIKDN